MNGRDFLWWPIWMYRQFRVLLWAEILILITSLISCDSQGEALPYPKSLCIAEGAPQKLSHPRSHFKEPILHLWHWFASLPLLKVGFFSSNVSKPHRAPALQFYCLRKAEQIRPPPPPPPSSVCLRLISHGRIPQIYVYRFPMKEGQPVQHPALCDKYGSLALGASTWPIDGAFS